MDKKWIRKKESFLKLEEWGLRAIKLKDSFLNNSQMAMVYMALKDKENGNKFFEKAEKIGKETNDPYLERLPMIKELCKQLFK